MNKVAINSASIIPSQRNSNNEFINSHCGSIRDQVKVSYAIYTVLGNE